MANKLFQEAREAVQNLTNAATGANQEKQLEVAKNCIQSAYANSSPEQQQQLQQLQQQIEAHEGLK